MGVKKAGSCKRAASLMMRSPQSGDGMTNVWADELVWESTSREFEIHRYRKLNGTQGHAICLESYHYDDCSDVKRLRDFFQCDERYYFLMAKAYIESIGFKVTNPEDS